MFGIGSQELMIIFLIAFFVFGARRLPELGKSLGQAIGSFKKAMEEGPKIEESQERRDSENLVKK
jgi:sec-independent protein translocase protein TatA